MKASLYLMDYTKEVIKKELFYKLTFFDSINGLVFNTYIHELSLKNNYIKLIDNGTPDTIKQLKKEVLQ